MSNQPRKNIFHPPRHHDLFFVISLCIVLSLLAGAAAAQELPPDSVAKPRLSIYGPNPHFFEYEGKPVALFGSGAWTILPDTHIDIREHNEWHARFRCNANRVTLFAYCTVVNEGKGLAPWERVDGAGLARDGKPKFDLRKENDAFWQRVHEYLSDCEKRRIFVVLQIFDESFLQPGESRWNVNPFNPENNVNDLPGLTPEGDTIAAFFDEKNSELLHFQEALIRRLLDETSRYGNVIYELCGNARAAVTTPTFTKWQARWGEFFHRYEVDHKVSLLLTNDIHYAGIPSDEQAFSVIDDRGFGGSASQIGLNDLNRRIFLEFDVFKRPILNSCPATDPDFYSATMTPALGQAHDRPRQIYWTYFCSGGHVVSLRTNNSKWREGRAAESICLGIHTLIDKLDLGKLLPRQDLVNTGFCLASPGYEYVIYLPQGGRVDVDLSDIAKGATLRASRYNPRTRAFADLGAYHQTDEQPFVMPTEGPGQDWVIHIGVGGGPHAKTPQRLTLHPTADTYLDKAAPTQNFGKAKTLRAGDGKIVLMRFEFKNPIQKVQFATLTLPVTKAGNTEADLWVLKDTSWTETKASWTTTRIDLPEQPVVRLNVSEKETSQRIEVTNVIRGQKTLVFAISAKKGEIVYASRESETPPTLRIWFSRSK